MKKTLTALCVAMASSGAMAWTSGDFNSTVNFGGTVESSEYKAKWEWQAGDSFSAFVNTLTELTENGTKLTITVTGDKPILMGRTTEAISPAAANLGAVPAIAFTDFQGATVAYEATGNGSNGAGFLSVPIKNTNDATKIGTLKVNLMSAGVAAKGNTDTSTVDLASLTAVNQGDMFYGGLKDASKITSAATAALAVEHFGNLSKTQLQQQVQAVNPALTTLTEKTAAETETLSDGKVVAAAYAMGMSNGQTLEATFDNAVTSRTEWSAPLNITVTYS